MKICLYPNCCEMAEEGEAYCSYHLDIVNDGQ